MSTKSELRNIHIALAGIDAAIRSAFSRVEEGSGSLQKLADDVHYISENENCIAEHIENTLESGLNGIALSVDDERKDLSDGLTDIEKKIAELSTGLSDLKEEMRDSTDTNECCFKHIHNDLTRIAAALEKGAGIAPEDPEQNSLLPLRDIADSLKDLPDMLDRLIYAIQVKG